jgi:hypothetical protein
MEEERRLVEGWRGRSWEGWEVVDFYDVFSGVEGFSECPLVSDYFSSYTLVSDYFSSYPLVSDYFSVCPLVSVFSVCPLICVDETALSLTSKSESSGISNVPPPPPYY